jgi:hypothetical protein
MTPLYMASQQGHTAVVEARAASTRLSHKATDVNQAEADTSSAPLYIASQQAAGPHGGG